MNYSYSIGSNNRENKLPPGSNNQGTYKVTLLEPYDPNRAEKLLDISGDRELYTYLVTKGFIGKTPKQILTDLDSLRLHKEDAGYLLKVLIIGGKAEEFISDKRNWIKGIRSVHEEFGRITGYHQKVEILGWYITELGIVSRWANGLKETISQEKLRQRLMEFDYNSIYIDRIFEILYPAPVKKKDTFSGMVLLTAGAIAVGIVIYCIVLLIDGTALGDDLSKIYKNFGVLGVLATIFLGIASGRRFWSSFKSSG